MEKGKDKYRLMAENMSDAFGYRINPDNGAPLTMMFVDEDMKIVVINGYSSPLLGKSLDEMIGQHAGEALGCLYAFDNTSGYGFGPRCNQCTIRNTVLDTIKTGSSYHQVEISLPFMVEGQAEEIFFLLSTMQVNAKKQTMAMVCLQDITARKKADNALLESRNLIYGVFQSIQDGISVLNPDLTIKMVNKTMERRYAHNMPLVGKKCYEAYQNSTQQCNPCPSLNAMKDKKLSVEVVPLTGEKGTEGWLEVYSYPLKDDQGNIEGVVEFVRDITERKRAEAELRSSEEKFQLLSENASDVIWTADLNWNITYISPSIEQLSGYTVEEIMSVSIEKIITTPTLEQAVQFFQKELALGVSGERDPARRQTLELKQYRKDGSIVWVEIKAAILRDKAGHPTGILGITRDITDRKKAEEALQKSEERYRLLVENANEAIVILQDGRYRFVNPKASEIFGRSREELLSRPVADFLHSEDRDFVQEHIDKSGRKEALQDKYSCRIVAGDGSIKWVEVNTVFLEWEGRTASLNIIDDITRQKQQERWLAQITREYETVFQGTQDAMFLVEVAGENTFRYIRSNRAHEECTGFSTEYIKGKTPYELVGEELGAKIAANYSRCIRGSVPISYEETLALPAGEITWATTLTPVFDEQSVYIVGSSQDITERQQMEERAQRQNQILLSLVKGKPLDAVLELIVSLLEVEDHGALGSILLLDDEGQHLLHGAAPRLPDFYNQAIHGLKIGEGVGSCGTAAYRGQRVVVEDILTHPYWESFKELALKANLRSCWSEPVLSAAGKVLATFAVYHREPHTPGNENIERIKVAASIASLAIEQRQAEKQLQEAYQHMDEIIEFLPDATFVIDQNGIVGAWNKSIEEMTGVPKKDMVGKGNYEYSIPFYGKHRPILIDLALRSESEFSKLKREYDVIDWKGSTLFSETYVPGAYGGKGAYLWATASKLYDAEGNVVGAIETIRNISERKRYEEELKYLSLHDQLSGLNNRAYFENELNRLFKSREYPITIISADIDNLKLINDTMGHDAGDEILKVCARVLKKSLRGSDILARVGGDEFVAILPRTGNKAGEEIASRIIFQVELYNSEQKGQFFLSISLGLSTAEDESRSLQETFKEADDLMYRDKLHRGTDASYQMIESLMTTLGERDFITEGHARRLEELCLKVGEKIKLSRKQFSNLSLLAQMHDLGKVGIPDQILFKEGSLDDKEQEIMRQHSEKGYRVALSSTQLSEIADLILKHHEYWDGSGYPLGIKGEEIPVECRILSIVDAYDAMTNDRPYRKAMSKNNAVEELKRCAGTQFDPELVEIFLSILDA